MSEPERTGSAAPGGRGGSDVIPFREALRVWFAISLQTFGGPAGQIAVMQRALVDEKRWIGQQRFLHALSYCTLLPGPRRSSSPSTSAGCSTASRGGLVAGTLFVLPGVVALLALSAIYVSAGDSDPGDSAVRRARTCACSRSSHRPCVRARRGALGHPALVALAVGAFVALWCSPCRSRS